MFQPLFRGICGPQMKLQLFILVLMLATGTLAQDSSATTRFKESRAKLDSYVNWPPEPAPIVTVSGRVVDPSGRPVPDAIVTLIPRDRETALITTVQRTLRTDNQGNFQINGVLPGSYLVVAKWSSEPKEYWSEQKIEAVDRDIGGLQLQLRPPCNLSGRVHASGTTDFGYKRLVVRVAPEDGNSVGVSSDVTEDGAFTQSDLRPTIYQLQVSGLPDGWYLHSAVLGEQNVLNQGLNLAEGNGGHQLEIEVSPGAGKVQGIVTEPVYYGRVPHALVEMFPDPPDPHRADLFQAERTDKYGSFTINNVVPGKYRVLAVTGKSGRDTTYDDAQLAATAGIRVSVGENQSKTLELELFEAHR